MHRPHCHELSESDTVRAIIVPEPHCENTGIISELDLNETLRGSMLLAGFGDVVEIHNATHEGEVAWTGLETTDICFFVVENWLQLINGVSTLMNCSISVTHCPLC